MRVYPKHVGHMVLVHFDHGRIEGLLVECTNDSQNVYVFFFHDSHLAVVGKDQIVSVGKEVIPYRN